MTGVWLPLLIAGFEVGASGGDNQLAGGAGNDRLISSGGDTLSGGAGDDEL